MNTKRSFEDRWNYMNQKKIKLEAEWVQAFIDGEGCFQCTILSIKDNKSTVKITNTLEIAQKSHDVKVLESIKLFFNKGYLKPKYDISSLKTVKLARTVSRYVVYADSEIINFFVKYPLYTQKHLDYLD
jgi:hypothetical protein